MSQTEITRIAEKWRELFSRGETGTNSNSGEQRNNLRRKGNKTNKTKQKVKISNDKQDNLAQTDLKGVNLDMKDIKAFGDQKNIKEDNMIRIFCQNINNIPKKKNMAKSKRMFKYWQEEQMDVVMCQEVGLNWRRIDQSDSWYERLHQVYGRDFRYQIDHNTQEADITGMFQRGGTAISTMGDLACRVIKTGGDKLGRWSWIQLQGRRERSIICMSLYLPVRSHEVGSTYMQQHRVLTNKGKDMSVVDVYKVFWEDLHKVMCKWYNEGNAIIVGGTLINM